MYLMDSLPRYTVNNILSECSSSIEGLLTLTHLPKKGRPRFDPVYGMLERGEIRASALCREASGNGR